MSLGKGTLPGGIPVINSTFQPTLLVNDLRRGETTGAIALWIGVGTEAYFANLHVTH